MTSSSLLEKPQSSIAAHDAEHPGLFSAGGLVWPLVGCQTLAWLLAGA